MKRNIVIIGLLFIVIIALSSCKTRPKCAAYGHYTYYETVKTESNQQ